MNVFITALIALGVVTVLMTHHFILAIRRQRFTRNAVRLSNDEFTKALQSPTHLAPVLITLRNTMATLCKVPADTIHPHHTPKELTSLISDWDQVVFILDLESAFHVEIPDEKASDFPSFVGERAFLWLKKPANSFGEWCMKAATWANQRIEAI